MLKALASAALEFTLTWPSLSPAHRGSLAPQAEAEIREFVNGISGEVELSCEFGPELAAGTTKCQVRQIRSQLLPPAVATSCCHQLLPSAVWAARGWTP